MSMSVRSLVPFVLTIVLASATFARAQDRSGVRSEVLSVPSGPGSVEGLGEAFEPSPGTGSSSYEVSIVVPPGVSGHAPSIGLHYASGSPSGELGLGWSLGLPTIQRSTDRRLPRYDASDRFVVRGLGSGAEELVQMGDGSFRMRIEGAYLRARRDSSGAWEVRTRSGDRFRFGIRAPDTIEDAGRVFSWLLSEHRDAHDNVISYEWSRDATGRPYLARIVYNDFSPSVRNEIVFEWESRADVLTSYVSTFAVTCARRLRAIVVSHGGARVRRYDLTYQETGVSRLASVRMSGRDDAAALPTLTLQYAALNANAMRVETMSNAPARALGVVTELDDVDGDALPDLLLMDPSIDGGTYSYYPNLDGSSFGARDVLDSTPSVWLDSPNVQLADMNGDGASDVVARVSSAADGLRYYPAAEGTFGAPVVLSPNVSTGFEDPNLKLVDLDHDRLTDWIRIDPTTGFVTAALNQGDDSFLVSTGLPRLDPNEVVSFAAGANLTDCNGDGLADVVLVRSLSIRCWASMGRGRFAAAVSLANAPALTGPELTQSNLHDLDGDGLLDVVLVGVSEIRAWLNRGGNSLSATPLVIAGTPTRDADTVVRIVDMNGNGSEDVVWIDPTNSAAPWRFLDVLADGAPGLLRRIDNGLGKVVTIDYAGIGTMRGWARANGIAWSKRCSVGQSVVSRITMSDSLGNDVVTEYHYADPYFDAVEREVRGFSQSEVRSVGGTNQPTLVVRRTFDVGDVDPARKGLPLTESQRTEGGQTFVSSATEYDVRVVGTAADGTVLRVAQRTSSESETFELGTTAVVTRSAWEHDDFGNVVTEANYGIVVGADVAFGADERITRRTYAIDTERWILDRVATDRVEDVAGAKLSETRTYYDGDVGAGLPLGSVSRGDVRRVETWLGGSRYAPVSLFEYDAFGNVVALTDARGSRRETTMDESSHTFFVRESQSTGPDSALVWTAEFDRASGNMTRFVDPNGAVTAMAFDGLERLVAIAEDGDSIESPTRSFRYTIGNPLSTVREETHADEGPSIVSIVHYDGLSRSRGSLRRGNGGEWIARDIVRFGERGWVTRTSNPFATRSADLPTSAEGPAIVKAYDALGRVRLTTLADGSTKETRYEAFATVEFDELDLDPSSPQFGSPTRFEKDGLDRLVRVVERDEGTDVVTSYAYDPRGNLTRIVDAAGFERTATYDARSLRIGLSDPNAGTWSFRYDDAGDLVVRTDPTGNRERFVLDVLGRVTEEWTASSGSEESLEVRRHYDSPSSSFGELGNADGMLAWVEDAAGAIYFGYDRRGRHSDTVRRWNDGTTHRVWTDFDAADREIRRGFPDGTHIETRYDERGLIAAVGPVVTDATYAPNGREATVTLGNGIVDSVDYDDRLRPVHLASRRGETTLRSLRMHYDAASLLRRIEDEREGAAGTDGDLSSSFQYDDRFRLARAETPRSDTSYVWDDIGNLELVTSSGSHPLPSLVYEYDPLSPNRPVRVGNESFTYDAAGRVLSDGERTLAWDPRGRLARVERDGVVEEYVYDFEGKRVEKRTTRGGQTSVSRSLEDDVEIRDGRVVRYVYANQRRVARLDALPESIARTTSPEAGGFAEHDRFDRFRLIFFLAMGGMLAFFAFFASTRRRRWSELALGLGLAAAACGPHRSGSDPRRDSDVIDSLPVATEFFHGDLLGTTVVSTAASGEVRSESATHPFGGERFRSGAADVTGFLGAERDAGSGLLDLRARPYREALGFFYAPDPISVFGASAVLDQPRVQSPYFYASGDPVNLSDRGGEWVETAADLMFIALDVHEIATQGASVANVAALTLDVVGLALPFVTGAGALGRGAVAAVRGTDRVNDARHAAQNADRGNDARRTGTAARHSTQNQPPPNRRPNPGTDRCPGGTCGRPGGSCFVAGTPVRVHSDGRVVSIDSLEIGDRVATVGDEACRDADVVRDNWRVVSLAMPNPDGSGDLIAIRLARPLAWIEAEEARVGLSVETSFPDVGLDGLARVERIDPMPPIGRGEGCVVTGTITHMNGYVRELRLANGSVFRATDLHPFYSATRGEWLHLRDLRVGEFLRLEDGSGVAIAAITEVPGVHRVYNLEVEVQHTYLVGDEGVWAHNPRPGCPSPNGRRGGQAHQDTVRRRADELAREGHTVTHGGGRRREESIDTTGGTLSRRHPDITTRAPDGTLHRENVGRSRSDGTPIARERRALDDIERATGSRPAYTPYDRGATRAGGGSSGG